MDQYAEILKIQDLFISIFLHTLGARNYYIVQDYVVPTPDNYINFFFIYKLKNIAMCDVEIGWDHMVLNYVIISQARNYYMV